MPSIASHDAIANIRAQFVKADDYDDIIPHHKYPCFPRLEINTQKQLHIWSLPYTFFNTLAQLIDTHNHGILHQQHLGWL